MNPVSKTTMLAFKQWGKMGGKRRAKNLSPLARQSISRYAALARWRSRKISIVSMSSVRLRESLWTDPVYLEEILSDGTLRDWKELRRKISDRPFGPEAIALERVLYATAIYGTTSLWKQILAHLRMPF